MSPCIHIYDIPDMLPALRLPLRTHHYMVLSESGNIDLRIVTTGNNSLLSLMLSISKTMKRLPSKSIFSFEFSRKSNLPPWSRVYPTELRTVQETLHVLITELAFCHVGSRSISVGASYHPIGIDRRKQRHDTTIGMGSIHCQQHIEQRNIAFRIRRTQYYPFSNDCPESNRLKLYTIYTKNLRLLRHARESSQSKAEEPQPQSDRYIPRSYAIRFEFYRPTR